MKASSETVIMRERKSDERKKSASVWERCVRSTALYCTPLQRPKCQEGSTKQEGSTACLYSYLHWNSLSSKGSSDPPGASERRREKTPRPRHWDPAPSSPPSLRPVASGASFPPRLFPSEAKAEIGGGVSENSDPGPDGRTSTPSQVAPFAWRGGVIRAHHSSQVTSHRSRAVTSHGQSRGVTPLRHPRRPRSPGGG